MTISLSPVAYTYLDNSQESPLAKLPDEILTIIFKELDSRGQHSFILTCKRFRALAWHHGHKELFTFMRYLQAQRHNSLTTVCQFDMARVLFKIPDFQNQRKMWKIASNMGAWNYLETTWPEKTKTMSKLTCTRIFLSACRLGDDQSVKKLLNQDRIALLNSFIDNDELDKAIDRLGRKILKQANYLMVTVLGAALHLASWFNTPSVLQTLLNHTMKNRSKESVAITLHKCFWNVCRVGDQAKVHAFLSSGFKPFDLYSRVRSVSSERQRCLEEVLRQIHQNGWGESVQNLFSSINGAESSVGSVSDWSSVDSSQIKKQTLYRLFKVISDPDLPDFNRASFLTKVFRAGSIQLFANTASLGVALFKGVCHVYKSPQSGLTDLQLGCRQLFWETPVRTLDAALSLSAILGYGLEGMLFFEQENQATLADHFLMLHSMALI